MEGKISVKNNHSDDGGISVKNSDEKLDLKMIECAKIINLRGHMAGRNPVLIHGPADIEVHKSKIVKFYLLNLN